MSTRKHYLNALFGWRGAIAGSDLPATARHVALTLSLHMSEIGGSCWPSVATLTDETGLSRRAVFGALAVLRREGWLTVEHRYDDDGLQTSSSYTATVPEVVHRGGAPGAPPGCTNSTPGVHTGGAPGAPKSVTRERQVKTRARDEVTPGPPSPDLERQARSQARAEELAGLVDDDPPPVDVHPKMLLARLRAEHPQMDTARHRHPAEGTT